jgi:hypothetical protein
MVVASLVGLFGLCGRGWWWNEAGRFGYNSENWRIIGLMARWPRHVWTSIFTYATVFVLFPLLCVLAYAWVRGWIF